jgi:hypothetical protein
MTLGPAAPGPAPELGDGVVVDGDEHDLRRRVQVLAQLGAQVIGLELDALQGGELDQEGAGDEAGQRQAQQRVDQHGLLLH